MTTSTLDMVTRILDIYRVIYHEIKWLDRTYNVRSDHPKDKSLRGEPRGLIVGTTKIPHGPAQVVTIALVFTRDGLELWKTYPDTERACDPLPSEWLRFMGEILSCAPSRVIKEFIRLLSLSKSGKSALEIVREGLKTALADSIRSKTDAINALATALCKVA